MNISNKKRKLSLSQKMHENFGSLKNRFEKRLSHNLSTIKSDLNNLESSNLKSTFNLNPKASKNSLIISGKRVKNVSELIDLAVLKMEEAYDELLPTVKELSEKFNTTLEDAEKTFKELGATESQIEDAVYGPRSDVGEAGRSLTMYQPRTRTMMKSNLTSEYKKNKKESDKTFLAYIKDPDTIEDLKNVDTSSKNACKQALKCILEIRDNLEKIKSSTISSHEKAIEKLKKSVESLALKIEEEKNQSYSNVIEESKEKLEKEQEKLDSTIEKNLKNPLKSMLNKNPVANKSSKTLKIDSKVIKDCDELETLTKHRLNFTINKLNDKVSKIADTLESYYNSVIDMIELNNMAGLQDAGESEKQKEEFEKEWQEKVTNCLDKDIDKLDKIKKEFNKLWRDKKKKKENQAVFEKLIDEPAFLKTVYAKGAKQKDSAVLYSVRLLYRLPRIFEKFKDKMKNIKKTAFEVYKKY